MSNSLAWVSANLALLSCSRTYISPSSVKNNLGAISAPVDSVTYVSPSSVNSS